MEALRIGRGEATLAASYSPAGEKVVVALHGAGEGTRDFFLYKHLHRVLPPGVAESIGAWRAARGDGVEVVVVPGAEHDLTLPDGTLAPGYERTLVEWLVAR